MKLKERITYMVRNKPATMSRNEMIIIRAEELDPTKLSFSPMKTSKNGRKSVYLYYNKKRLYLQLPKLRAPFGVSSYPNTDKQHLDLSLSELENKDLDIVKKVIERLTEMDKSIVQSASKNSKDWFGSVHTEEELTGFYNNSVRQSNNKEKKYPPTFRQKFVKRDGDHKVTIFDSGKEEVDLRENDIVDVIGKGMQVKSLVQVVGLWFMGDDRFGVDFRAYQMKVWPPQQRIQGYAFLDDSDDESDSDGPEPDE